MTKGTETKVVMFLLSFVLSKCDIGEAVNGWLIGIEEKEKESLSLIHALYARWTIPVVVALS